MVPSILVVYSMTGGERLEGFVTRVLTGLGHFAELQNRKDSTRLEDAICSIDYVWYRGAVSYPEHNDV